MRAYTVIIDKITSLVFIFFISGSTNTTSLFDPGFNTTVNKPVEFNNPFLQPTTHSASTPNLLDDILTPETAGPSHNEQLFLNNSPKENNIQVQDGRLTGDLNKGLERVALSLG